MNYLKKLFDKEKHERMIRLNANNSKLFPKFEALFNSEKVKFDSKGRLRYLHGAPVGDMVFYRIDKDNTPIYKESTEEWFDPDSPRAKDFIWE